MVVLWLIRWKWNLAARISSLVATRQRRGWEGLTRIFFYVALGGNAGGNGCISALSALMLADGGPASSALPKILDNTSDAGNADFYFMVVLWLIRWKWNLAARISSLVATRQRRGWEGLTRIFFYVALGGNAGGNGCISALSALMLADGGPASSALPKFLDNTSDAGNADFYFMVVLWLIRWKWNLAARISSLVATRQRRGWDGLTRIFIYTWWWEPGGNAGGNGCILALSALMLADGGPASSALPKFLDNTSDAGDGHQRRLFTIRNNPLV